MFDNIRKVTTMVDVGMGKDHGVNAGRLEGEVKVTPVRLLPSSLVQPAVEQHATPIDINEMA
jgi:hypothetical protein